jgi:hypothetical protein
MGQRSMTAVGMDHFQVQSSACSQRQSKHRQHAFNGVALSALCPCCGAIPYNNSELEL